MLANGQQLDAFVLRKQCLMIFSNFVVYLGGRWQQGVANGPGEEAEQVNSYISRLGSTAKRMSAAGKHVDLKYSLRQLHFFIFNRHKLK